MYNNSVYVILDFLPIMNFFETDGDVLSFYCTTVRQVEKHNLAKRKYYNTFRRFYHVNHEFGSKYIAILW